MSKDDADETNVITSWSRLIQTKVRRFFNLPIESNGSTIDTSVEDVSGTTIFLRNMLTGGLAASVAVTAMAPIERIKLILQVQSCTNKPEYHYRGLMDALTRIPKEQGVLSLWRGNFASVIRGFPYQALNFAFRDKFRDYFSRGFNKKTQFSKRFVGNLLSGGVAGASSMAILYPLDYARTRMAMDFGKSKATREYKNIRVVIMNTYKRDGLRGVYRGFWFSIMGVFIYRSAYFGLFDTAKDLTPENYRHTLLFSFMNAELAATTSGFISYPFDTVRRSMMMQSGKIGTDKFYESSLDCIQKILKTKGYRGFFNGAFTNVIRGTGGAIMLVLYDEIQYAFWRRPILQPHHPSSLHHISSDSSTWDRSGQLHLVKSKTHSSSKIKHYCPKHSKQDETQEQCPVRIFAERVNLICDF